MTEAKMVRDFVLRDENLEVAFMVAHHVPAIKDKLIRVLVSDLRVRFQETHPTWHVSMDDVSHDNKLMVNFF